MKVKMYGQKRFLHLPNNKRDLRYLEKLRRRNREKQTAKPVAAAWKKIRGGKDG